MPRRVLNAVFGFCVGSMAYYVSLFVIAALGSQHWLPWQTFTFRCFLRSSGLWFRLVSAAELSHRLQPHYLYLCALIGALLFSRINRPFRQDIPLYTHRFAGLSWLFASAVVINLWFSVANLFPRFGL